MKGNPIYRLIGLGIIVSSILAQWSGQADFTQPTWLWIPVFMAVMMIQATFTGFCPMAKFFGQDPETGACCGADTTGTCCTGSESKAEESSSCCSGGETEQDATTTSNSAQGSSEAQDETAAEGVLVVKVLGTGCANCVSTYQLFEQQAEKLGVPIQLEKVEEIADIASYGVMSTPGVVINGKVVHAGGVPSVKQIDIWLTETK
ncbi:MTH895/ArsE family thioredoxin-like protein [Galenea microaerophila]